MVVFLETTKGRSVNDDLNHIMKHLEDNKSVGWNTKKTYMEKVDVEFTFDGYGTTR